MKNSVLKLVQTVLDCYGVENFERHYLIVSIIERQLMIRIKEKGVVLYNTIQEAKQDGWLLIPCAFPTTHRYYMRHGVQMREDELIKEQQ